MNNAIQIFNNPEFGNVRTITDPDGTVLFCGKDVATALGYEKPRNAIERHCKGALKRGGVSFTTNQYGKTTEQVVEMSFITEGDLYRLICNSKLPSAQKFERWVFDEILPTIRHTGGYLTPEKVEEALCNPDVLIQLATQIKQLRSERDEAIRTKYHIMAGRDATAMNTASRAVQRANKAEAALAELRDEIGEGETWKKIKALDWPKKIFVQNQSFRTVFGKYIKEQCALLGIEPCKVPDPDYGEVNAYPTALLETIRHLIETDKTILAQYRKGNR